MANPEGNIELPGLRAHWVGHPTDIDNVGCDGLYFEGFEFVDYQLWLRYCNFVCRPFLTFSVN
jgi:hypothetical protein